MKPMQNPLLQKTLDPALKEKLAKIASTIRGLSIDAVQKANSGHPGLPLGDAEIGAYLWGVFLKYNPKNPDWMNRDRFILSAGHGSMLLYSVLHLSGYDLSLEDLKQFRQLHSKTPGHPESLDTPGVETTTGPLGQGLGNAIGQALGLKLLETKFNTDSQTILDSKVIVLMGDGCVMEGVSNEVSSLAGHLQLNNVIAIYDANGICLDGPISETLSENTKLRYQALGWDVKEIDGNNLDAIHEALAPLRERQEKPTLIIAHTVIGKGSPNKAGTSSVHGSPLGAEEVRLTKENLGIPEEPFYVPQSVKDFFREKLSSDEAQEILWKKNFDGWSHENPALRSLWDEMKSKALPHDLEKQLKELVIKSPVAGRKASQETVTFLGEELPFLYGGSADLSVSDLTMMKPFPIVKRGEFKGRNIKFGVREFGMATMASGLAETGMILPFIGTFLTFSDYMRNAIRLASLMKLQVVYQFTHDSIFLGEDGPTHQPVEHYAALRAIPQLQVIRPGDAREVKMSWLAALYYKGPTALLLSRQNIPEVPGTDVPYAEGVGRGAYLIKKEKGKADYTLIATGSELALAYDVAVELEKKGKQVRLVSMPSWEIFEAQDEAYKKSIFGGDIGKRVSIEAGVEQGWHKYIGFDGIAISVDRFGASAPEKALAEAYGFTTPAILDRIL
jgi:transketolase